MNKSYCPFRPQQPTQQPLVIMQKTHENTLRYLAVNGNKQSNSSVTCLNRCPTKIRVFSHGKLGVALHISLDYTVFINV